MLNAMQKAIIKKDLRFVKEAKGNLSSIIIVSLIFGVVFPAMFILIMHFVPYDELGDFAQILNLTSAYPEQYGAIHTMLVLLLNNIIPLFFLIIPVISATTMAAGSFVGEKEKRTLETLLYCPLSLRQIFSAKVLATFFMSMAVTVGSFVAFVIISQLLLFFTLGYFILPGLNWLILILIVTPAISLLAVTIISKISVKAQTVEEAFQKAGLLALPVIMLGAGQLTGLMLINEWMMLLLGAIIGFVAWIMMRSAVRNYNYEALLK
jgi:hypothetical protein